MPVTGQIMVVTAEGVNIPMAHTVIHVVPDEQLKAIAATLATRISEQVHVQISKSFWLARTAGVATLASGRPLFHSSESAAHQHLIAICQHLLLAGWQLDGPVELAARVDAGDPLGEQGFLGGGLRL